MVHIFGAANMSMVVESLSELAHDQLVMLFDDGSVELAPDAYEAALDILLGA